MSTEEYLDEDREVDMLAGILATMRDDARDVWRAAVQPSYPPPSLCFAPVFQPVSYMPFQWVFVSHYNSYQ